MTPPSEIMLTLSVPDVGGMSEQCCRSALKSADLSLLVFHFARCWIYPPIPTDKSVDSLPSLLYVVDKNYNVLYVVQMECSMMCAIVKSWVHWDPPYQWSRCTFSGQMEPWLTCHCASNRKHVLLCPVTRLDKSKSVDCDLFSCTCLFKVHSC